MPMDAATTPSTKPRKLRKSRKLDPKKTQEMAERGLSNQEIATLIGVNPSTVYRFLEHIKPEQQALAAYKSHRADVFARLQARNLDFQEAILEQLEKDGLAGALSPHQKIGLMFALNTQLGTLFDKERLERGQSTANISTVSKMIDGQVSSLYKRSVIPPVVSEPDIIMTNPEVVDNVSDRRE
jgi:predicted transcriptional regulator